MNLKVFNLSKSYDGKSNALQDVNFEISGTGLYLITGDNGSGKTTLFNLIAGLDKPTKGQIYFNGKDVGTMNEKELCKYRRDSVSYIFQDYNLIGDLSVYENLAIVTGGKNSNVINAVLEKVEMSEYKDKKVSDLSGGQKQRTAIARAFIKNSNIVLADEITASLDNEISAKIVSLLIQLAKIKCVIVITHSKEKFEEFFNREIHLDHGQIKFDNISNEIQNCIDTEKTNKLSFKTLYRFARTNLFKRKTKKIYLLIFSVILLTAGLISISSISFGYKSMVSKILNDYGQQYILCTATPKVFDGVNHLQDNNYAAATNSDYNLPSEKNLFWLPMMYGRSEHIVELEPGFDGSKVIKGRSPKSLNEIAVTDYVADYIIAYGNKEGGYYTGYDDILNDAEITITYLRSSFRLKVVGIIQTDYKKFKSLQDVAANDLSFTLDDSYFNSSLRWKLNDMLGSCTTKKDRQFYLYIANALNYYNLFYVCHGFEAQNYSSFTRLNVVDDEALKHNVPTFYSLNKQEYCDSKIYFLENGQTNGVIAPLSGIVDSNTLDDMYSVYQNEERVFEECCKKIYKDITVQIKEMTLKPFESFEANRLVVSEDLFVIGFYNDYFSEEQKTDYYLTDIAFEKITDALANYKPSSISAYIDFESVKNKDAVISAVLGDFVPNGNMSFPEKLIVDEGYSQLKIVQAVFIAVFVLMFALSIVFLSQIIIDDIKENEKNYAIMKSLGLTNTQLVGIAIFTPLILFLFASIISVLLAYAGIALLNIWLVNGFLNIGIVSVTWLGILGLVGILAVSLSFGACIGLRKLIKQPPIKLLKNR